jgi:N6-L-threonylcarbamoyladenine synthase
MRVLGIESSCDETAAAVVEYDGNSWQLLSNAIASSMDEHARYGGIVPENAARSHIEAIMPVITRSLDEAGCTWDDIDAIAVTYGAGLGGSLLIGVLAARTLAIVKQKPLYAINHVEGHLYANFITHTSLPGYKLPESLPQFPVLGLIVSGGHSQLVLFRDHFDYIMLGQTQDDAVGEAFDKVGRLLGLPYPGGISVSKKAKEGDAHRFKFPKARMAGKYDFSFSGVKTAVLRTAQELIGEDHTFSSTQIAGRLTDQQKADIAASFERTALETIVDKTVLAYEEFSPATVIVGGGVAGSQPLRTMLADRLPCPIIYTDPQLCTDNGAMIAALACLKRSLGQPEADPYTLDINPSLSM